MLNLTNKKLNDTNSFEPKTAVKSILGSLKSMGIRSINGDLVNGVKYLSELFKQ